MESDDPRTLEMLTWLAKRLGVKIYPDNNKDTLKAREHLKKVIEKGGDMSYIENPVEWQKNIRKDR